jgi:hypothetical protein
MDEIESILRTRTRISHHFAMPDSVFIGTDTVGKILRCDIGNVAGINFGL